MGDIHHLEHLPTNERQLLGSNGVWLNVACSDIYFPSENILTHLFQIVRHGGHARLPSAKPVSDQLTNHTAHKASWVLASQQGFSACMLVTHPPPGPLGEGPRSWEPCPHSQGPPMPACRMPRAHSSGRPTLSRTSARLKVWLKEADGKRDRNSRELPGTT